MLNKSWNPALNMFLEIKNAYIKEFGLYDMYGIVDKFEISEKLNYIDKYGLYEEDEPLFTIKGTVLGYWVAKLVYHNINYLKYAKVIQPLELNQHKFMLLMRYGDDKSMWEDDFWNQYDGLYRECRSVVIDIEQDNLIMTPFKKFFNLNEMPETEITLVQKKLNNAKTIEFTDKLDGSMQCARYYLGDYIMSGSQSLNPNNSWRLADGYSKLTSNHKLLLAAYPECTFIFEYISEEDAHVVKYDKSQEGLYLIGVREVYTGNEWDYDKIIKVASHFNIPTTKMFDKTFDEILNELDVKSSDEAEGFVLNIDGFKIKIKYNDYTKVHKILSKISSINVVIECVANGNFDDLYSKIPNAHKPRILAQAKCVMTYDKLIREEVAALYEEAMEYAEIHLDGSSLIREFMTYIDACNRKKNIKGYAKCVYYGKAFNTLKHTYGGQESYIKYHIIEKYLEVKNNENRSRI